MKNLLEAFIIIYIKRICLNMNFELKILRKLNYLLSTFNYIEHLILAL